MPFPCEAFKGELYRLVHSPEEHATALAEGWSTVRDPAVAYKPLSSTWVLPKRESAQVTAPGISPKVAPVAAPPEFEPVPLEDKRMPIRIHEAVAEAKPKGKAKE